jgi:uncharacterized protein YcfJ
MKNLVKTLAPLALIATWPAAHSQEMARVVSSTPIVQQVTVPRQVCSETQILVQHPVPVVWWVRWPAAFWAIR